MDGQLTTEQRALLAQLHGTIRKASKAIGRRLKVDPEDMLGIGFLAAVEVTKTFDAARNEDVAQFGYLRIAGEMIDSVKGEARTGFVQLLAHAHRFAAKASGVLDRPDPFASDEVLKLELESALEVVTAAAVVAIGAGRTQESPEDALDDRRLGAALERAVRQLPDEQRRLIDLIFFEELTLDEAAVALGLSPRTARRRKRDALEALRTALLAEHREPP